MMIIKNKNKIKIPNVKKKKTLHPTQKEVEKIVKKNTRLVPVR